MVEKSWRSYINNVGEKIHTITPEWEAKLGKGKILIPDPLDIERLINLTQAGQLLTTDIIREKLAQEKGVQLTASAPTKIYLKHIALASEEERSTKKHTPYWRVLLPKGVINEKFPGGYERQIQLLEKEGHDIGTVGRKKIKYVVANHEASLMKL